jgi:exodeoxyribonuclease VII small subunit
MVTNAKAAPSAPASYEAALQELEQLVARLESGDLPLAQLLSQYQRGAELLAFCRDRLEAVEGQVKLLEQGVLKTWTAEER